MDNLTHSLVGLAAAKAGLERQSPYAATVCIVAANLPDIDIVTLARGPYFYLANHRGITHSIVGTLALGVAFPLLFFAAERLVAKLRGREPRARLGGLLVCSLLLAGSHPLLDFANSYGLRPFLPWDGRWVYGDILFIVDPWIWLMLGGACFLLTATTRVRVWAWSLLALVLTLLFLFEGRRVGASVTTIAQVLWLVCLSCFLILRRLKVAARLGPKLALAALSSLVVYCGVLAFAHAIAYGDAFASAQGAAEREGARLLRVAATPTLADPLAWRCFAETDRSTFRFDLMLGGAEAQDARGFLSIEKPQGEDARLVGRASADERARVLLDFARFPVERVRRTPGAWPVVEFADLRFTEPGVGARQGGFALDVPVAPEP